MVAGVTVIVIGAATGVGIVAATVITAEGVADETGGLASVEVAIHAVPMLSGITAPLVGLGIVITKVGVKKLTKAKKKRK